MEAFTSYLLSRHFTNDKGVGFYLSWLKKFYRFCAKHPGDPVTREEIEKYLVHLSRRHEEWKVNQASDAVRLYLYYLNQKDRRKTNKRLPQSTQWKVAADDMRKVLRLKHRSLRTERTYMGWVRKFYRFLNGKSPHDLESKDVKDFMTHLAVDMNVAVSTQNQAFNAILFLYRHVLNKQIEEIRDAVRARRKTFLPAVLTKSEVESLFEQLSGIYLQRPPIEGYTY
jgi:hypothetical protein